MESIKISASSLKNMLKLFNSELVFSKLEFGDTWYPNKNFINEDILDGNLNLQNLLEFDYDFKGLVLFDAVLETMSITYLKNETPENELHFEIKGAEKDIRILINNLWEVNVLDSCSLFILDSFENSKWL